MVYLFVVSPTIFLRGWSDNLDPLPQLMVSSFTTMVGVIIAFYFTSSAYVEAQKKHRKSSGDREAGFRPAQQVNDTGFAAICAVHPGYILTPLIAQGTDTELKSALEGMHPLGRLG
jgi:hypothetical protein